MGDLFTVPGPGEAEEAELRWEQEEGGHVSEQRGLEVRDRVGAQVVIYMKLFPMACFRFAGCDSINFRLLQR